MLLNNILVEILCVYNSEQYAFPSRAKKILVYKVTNFMYFLLCQE